MDAVAGFAHVASPTAVSRRPVEPAPVLLDHAAAGRMALASFVPEQAPELRGVDCFSAVDFWEQLDHLQVPEVKVNGDRLPLLTSTSALVNDGTMADQVLCLVEIEAGSPRQWGPDMSHWPAWGYRGQAEAGGEGRLHPFYLVNASTGTPLGSLDRDLGPDREAVLWAALRARPIKVQALAEPAPSGTDGLGGTPRVEAVATPMATAPATRAPTLPSLPADLCLPADASPQPLAPDAIPAPLATTFEWLPLLAGATWVYERTEAFNDAHWQRLGLTVTLAARWRLAADALLVQFQLDRSGDVKPLGHPFDTVHDLSAWAESPWVIVLPNAAFHVGLCRNGDRPPTLAQRRRWLAGAARGEKEASGDWDVLLEPLMQGDTSVQTRWRLDAEPDLPSPLVLQGDEFRGCRRYGNGQRMHQRGTGLLCPGIGWVGQTTRLGASAWFIQASDILVDHRIPEGRRVP